MAASFIDEEAEAYLPLVAEAFGLARYVLFGHSVGGVAGVSEMALVPHREKQAQVLSRVATFLQQQALVSCQGCLISYRSAVLGRGEST